MKKQAFYKQLLIFIFMQCLYCEKTIQEGNKYCSVQCQANERKNLSIDLWLKKEIPGHTGIAMGIKPFVRSYMIKKAGFKCSKCNWNTPHPLTGIPPLEINHIDGDASNTFIENLEALCPNCHSLTPTYKNRNKNGKRSR